MEKLSFLFINTIKLSQEKHHDVEDILQNN